jgi:hypothetical protein
MTAAERQRRRRDRLAGRLPAWAPKPKRKPPQIDWPAEFLATLKVLDVDKF